MIAKIKFGKIDTSKIRVRGFVTYVLPLALVFISYKISQSIKSRAAEQVRLEYSLNLPQIHYLPSYNPINMVGGEVIFEFDYDGGPGEIIFAAGGIEYEDEVSIFVNGLFVGRANIAHKKWGFAQRILVDEHFFVYGKNYLTFRNNYPNEKWGIRFVNVNLMKKAVPDISKAESYYRIALRTLSEGSKENLPDASKYLRSAIEESYNAIPKPIFWNDAIHKLEEVEEMLDAIFYDILKRCIAIFEKDSKEASFRESLRCLEDIRNFFRDEENYRVKFIDVQRVIMEAMIKK